MGARLKHAWDVFRNKEPTSYDYRDIGPASTVRLDRIRLRSTTERSIVAAIYNRIAIDVSEIKIQHVRQDENDRYKETVHSGLNYILTTEANIDQTNKTFIQDIVLSMFDEGVVAIIPVDTDIDPTMSNSYDIKTLRTAKVIDWYPRHVRVRVYNDKTGKKEDKVLPKNIVALVENPLYTIMNEPNGTLKRLIRKLNLLDAIDEQSSAGKLDLIIQLPYIIKTDARKKQAEERRKDIEMQLAGSKYGIAYTDGTEKVTQLNRATENNLMEQVKYLTTMLYNQLGFTEGIFDGTANESTMLNYHNRTVSPIVSAITDEMDRKFLTKTARTQGQTIMAFKDAFKLVPVESLAEIADKFTRNEILSSNEIRSIIGFKPSEDPGAEELRNKNLNSSTLLVKEQGTGVPMEQTGEVSQNGIDSDQAMALFEELLNGLEEDIDSIIGGSEVEE